MSDIEKRLEEIFRDVFDDENLSVSAEMNIKEIDGWDSLIHISLLAAIQDEFGVSYGIDDISSMETVGDIIVSIQSRQS